MTQRAKETPYLDWLDAVCVALRALGKDSSDLGKYCGANPDYWKQVYLSGASPDRAAVIADIPAE